MRYLTIPAPVVVDVAAPRPDGTLPELGFHVWFRQDVAASPVWTEAAANVAIYCAAESKIIAAAAGVVVPLTDEEHELAQRAALERQASPTYYAPHMRTYTMRHLLAITSAATCAPKAPDG